MILIAIKASSIEFNWTALNAQSLQPCKDILSADTGSFC